MGKTLLRTLLRPSAAPAGPSHQRSGAASTTKAATASSSIQDEGVQQQEFELSRYLRENHFTLDGCHCADAEEEGGDSSAGLGEGPSVAAQPAGPCHDAPQSRGEQEGAHVSAASEQGPGLEEGAGAIQQGGEHAEAQVQQESEQQQHQGVSTQGVEEGALVPSAQLQQEEKGAEGEAAEVQAGEQASGSLKQGHGLEQGLGEALLAVEASPAALVQPVEEEEEEEPSALAPSHAGAEAEQQQQAEASPQPGQEQDAFLRMTSADVGEQDGAAQEAGPEAVGEQEQEHVDAQATKADHEEGQQQEGEKQQAELRQEHGQPLHQKEEEEEQEEPQAPAPAHSPAGAAVQEGGPGAELQQGLCTEQQDGDVLACVAGGQVGASVQQPQQREQDEQQQQEPQGEASSLPAAGTVEEAGPPTESSEGQAPVEGEGPSQHAEELGAVEEVVAGPAGARFAEAGPREEAEAGAAAAAAEGVGHPEEAVAEPQDAMAGGVAEAEEEDEVLEEEVAEPAAEPAAEAPPPPAYTAQEEACASFCLALLQLRLGQEAVQEAEAQARAGGSGSGSSGTGGSAMDRLARLCAPGVLPSLLLNAIMPGTLDERALNLPLPALPFPSCDSSNGTSSSHSAIPPHLAGFFPAASTSSPADGAPAEEGSEGGLGSVPQGLLGGLLPSEREENWRLACACAGSLGATQGLGERAAHELVAGQPGPVLGFLLDMVRAALLAAALAAQGPGRGQQRISAGLDGGKARGAAAVGKELALLQQPGESEAEFRALSPELLLARWAAHHLTSAAASAGDGCAAATERASSPPASPTAAGASGAAAAAAAGGGPLSPGVQEVASVLHRLAAHRQAAGLVGTARDQGEQKQEESDNDNALEGAQAGEAASPDEAEAARAAAAAASQLPLGLPVQAGWLLLGGPGLRALVLAAAMGTYPALRSPQDTAAAAAAAAAAAQAAGSSGGAGADEGLLGGLEAASGDQEEDEEEEEGWAAGQAGSSSVVRSQPGSRRATRGQLYGLGPGEDGALLAAAAVSDLAEATTPQQPGSASVTPARQGYKSSSSSSGRFAAALAAVEAASGAVSSSKVARTPGSAAGTPSVGGGGGNRGRASAAGAGASEEETGQGTGESAAPAVVVSGATGAAAEATAGAPASAADTAVMPVQAHQGQGSALKGGAGARGQGGRAGLGSGGPKQVWAGEDDEGLVDTQEERLLRAWLNSLLSAKGVRLASLFDPAMRTGYPLLLACDAIAPGCVRWGRAFTPPFSGKRAPFKLMCSENGNQVCDICVSQWHLPLVNIGGVDIAEGHRGALLSLVWQMMRHHMSSLLGSLLPGAGPSGGGAAAGASSGTSAGGAGRNKQQIEEDVLRWANDTLAGAAARLGAPPPSPLAGFSDPRLAQGWLLLQLLAAISPRSVSPVHVLAGATDAERASNAKYVISVARKLGCTVFIVWEDIVGGNEKNMLMLLASLMALHLRLTAQRQQQQQQQQQQASSPRVGQA